MSVRLENFPEAEKNILKTVLKRRIFLRGIIFFLVIAVCIGIMIYFNKNSSIAYIEDNIGLINVAFVIITVICTRMVIADWMEFNKEISYPMKKVIDTRIALREGEKIFVGNKSFSKDEFLLEAQSFDSLQAGDNVRIELSAKTDTLFSIKRI